MGINIKPSRRAYSIALPNMLPNMLPICGAMA